MSYKGHVCTHCGKPVDWIDYESGRGGFWYHIHSGIRKCMLDSEAEPLQRGRHLSDCKHEFVVGTTLSDEYSPAVCKRCGKLEGGMGR